MHPRAWLSAPTRLALAGAATGLLAGTLGAAVYVLHCPESNAPFLGVWYVLGMAIPTAVGALLGPRLRAGERPSAALRCPQD